MNEFRPPEAGRARGVGSSPGPPHWIWSGGSWNGETVPGRAGWTGGGRPFVRGQTQGKLATGRGLFRNGRPACSDARWRREAGEIGPPRRRPTRFRGAAPRSGAVEGCGGPPAVPSGPQHPSHPSHPPPTRTSAPSCNSQLQSWRRAEGNGDFSHAARELHGHPRGPDAARRPRPRRGPGRRRRPAPRRRPAALRRGASPPRPAPARQPPTASRRLWAGLDHDEGGGGAGGGPRLPRLAALPLPRLLKPRPAYRNTAARFGVPTAGPSRPARPRTDGPRRGGASASCSPLQSPSGRPPGGRWPAFAPASAGLPPARPPRVCRGSSRAGRRLWAAEAPARPRPPGRRRRPRGRSHLDSRRGGSVRPPPAAVVPGPGLSSSPGPDAGPAGHPARPFPSPASRAGWLGSVPGPRARALRAPPDRVGG